MTYAMPEHLRKRQVGGEQARFTWAFNECLRREPNKAPGPTAINLLLGKRPPLNVMPGRQSVLRRRLLVEAGFVKDDKWGRWKRPTRCSACGHRPHNRLGFCANMAGDNDCSCRGDAWRAQDVGSGGGQRPDHLLQELRVGAFPCGCGKSFDTERGCSAHQTRAGHD